MKTAMKAHDATKLEVIRFLRAEIKNAQIDGAGSDDAAIQKVIASQVKKSKDAVAEFEAADRGDLADAERAKIAIMEQYLPAQLSDEELEKVIRDLMAQASDAVNPGRLIGMAVQKVAGQADGGRIKQMIDKIMG